MAVPVTPMAVSMTPMAVPMSTMAVCVTMTGMIMGVTMTSMIVGMTMTHNCLYVFFKNFILGHVGLFGPLECRRFVMAMTMMIMSVSMSRHLFNKAQTAHQKHA
jgi:hypothetical protein